MVTNGLSGIIDTDSFALVSSKTSVGQPEIDTQTHPVGQNTLIKLIIQELCSLFSPTKNLFTIMYDIWQETVNIRAEIEISARPLPI